MTAIRRASAISAIVGITAVSAGLAALQPGRFLLGWLGFSALGLIMTLAIYAGWRAVGGGRTVAWMAVIALALRLAAGIATYLALPVNGYDEPDDRAGFVFTDAHRRDDQAWELARSPQPLTAAFDKAYYTDQYGGLLALSALTYRALSPDAHRPLLVLFLAAAAAAAGVPLFWGATKLLWGERLAAFASWLYVAYPESVLTGGAQMREPFLLTLIAGALLGFAVWQVRGTRSGLGLVGGALLGMLLVSPAIAVVTVVLLLVWLQVRSEIRHVPWAVLLAAVAIALLGTAFIVWSLSQRASSSGSIIGVVSGSLKNSVEWVIFQLEQGSGQVQNVFSKLVPAAQYLFVVGYGITQPLLPPAFLEPTTVSWRIIAVVRAAGWYLLLPLLVYALFSLPRRRMGAERAVWLWLVAFTWMWILVCSVRAGGDQWDNPRYRLIFFGIQALVAGRAWLAWRDHKDPWLPRVLACEIVCLLFFGQWYLARYYLIGIHFPILVVMASSLVAVAAIVVGGVLWDSRQAHVGQMPDQGRAKDD
jgi:hypothetical protein